MNKKIIIGLVLFILVSTNICVLSSSAKIVNKSVDDVDDNEIVKNSDKSWILDVFYVVSNVENAHSNQIQFHYRKHISVKYTASLPNYPGGFDIKTSGPGIYVYEKYRVMSPSVSKLLRNGESGYIFGYIRY